MKKIVRLNENDLSKLIKKIIQEQEVQNFLTPDQDAPGSDVRNFLTGDQKVCIPQDITLRKVYEAATKMGFTCQSTKSNETVLIGKGNVGLILVPNISMKR